MEPDERKGGRMSVPQFGGWDQNDPGLESGYTVVFTKARADRMHQKTDLTEVKRQSLEREQNPNKKDPHKKYGLSNQHHQHPDHAVHQLQPPPAAAMEKKKVLSIFTCCIVPR